MVPGKFGVGGVGDEVAKQRGGGTQSPAITAFCLGCFLSCQPGQGAQSSVRLCRAGELGRFRGRVRSS